VKHPELDKVKFKVKFSDLNEVLAAGYTKEEVTKEVWSWTVPETWKRRHKVFYYIFI